MPSLGISRAIRAQILPEDSVALDRLERDSPSAPTTVVAAGPCGLCCIFLCGRLLLALEQLAPLLARRSLHAWEVRAASGAVGSEVDHEGADAISAVGSRSCPVVVVTVVAGCIVPLRPHALNVEVRPPALE